MITKTQLVKRIYNKQSSEIVETILQCKKNAAWLNVGQIISGSRKNFAETNLDKINKEAKEGEIIVVPGKVLAQGEINKKIKVVALSFSEAARDKLKDSKSEVITILEEIKKNPSAKGIKIIR